MSNQPTTETPAESGTILRGVNPSDIIVTQDGADFCAHYGDFQDLQASPASFSSTPTGAVLRLIVNHPRK